MPSKSPAQQRLMQAAAHTPGGYDGVPRSVGRGFANADKRAGRREHLAQSTDVPEDKGSGRARGAKARTHKTQSRTGA